MLEEGLGSRCVCGSGHWVKEAVAIECIEKDTHVSLLGTSKSLKIESQRIRMRFCGFCLSGFLCLFIFMHTQAHTYKGPIYNTTCVEAFGFFPFMPKRYFFGVFSRPFLVSLLPPCLPAAAEEEHSTETPHHSSHSNSIIVLLLVFPPSLIG